MNFDNEDRLNEDGTVTITLVPSAWHGLNISPDTYHLFDGDSLDSDILDWYREESELDIEWNDLDWTYNHPQIVRSLAESCMDWIAATLMEAGLESMTDVKLLDSWSPREYNFTSDGFEMEFKCDPKELRDLTKGFDVDAWAMEHYSSYDGFYSYVTGRLTDPEWRAGYDGEFRVQSLLMAHEDKDVPWWVSVVEDASEIYMNNTTVEPSVEVFSASPHIPRIDDAGDVVRYESGKGWSCDEEEYYELLDYHREVCKLVALVTA